MTTSVEAYSAAIGPAPVDGVRFRSLFLKLAPAMFLGSLDQTIVATALPAMAVSLGNFIHIAWVVSAYLLAATFAAPVYGKLGDAYGRRKALMGALVLFVLGSIACTFAPNFTALVAGRILQGLGGGGLMTLAQALIGESVSPRERGKFQGWFSGTFALASTIGPLAGGFLSDTWGWRSIFWINILLGGLAALAVSRVRAEPGAGRMQVDIAGNLCLVAACTALLVALSFGVSLGFLQPVTIALAAGSLLAFALLLWIEQRAAAPLIPVDLLAESAVWRCSLAVLLSAAVQFAAVVELPLFLQLVLSLSPTQAGLMLIPLMLSQVVMALIVGGYVSRSGHTGKFMALGFSISAMGFFCLALLLRDGLWIVAATSCLIGLGIGAVGPVSQTIVQWAGGLHRLGRATGLMSLSRSIGGLLGTALVSALLIGAFQSFAPDLTAQIARALRAGTSAPALSLGSQQAATSAFRVVFLALASLSAFAALLCSTIPDVDVAKTHQD